MRAHAVDLRQGKVSPTSLMYWIQGQLLAGRAAGVAGLCAQHQLHGVHLAGRPCRLRRPTQRWTAQRRRRASGPVVLRAKRAWTLDPLHGEQTARNLVWQPVLALLFDAPAVFAALLRCMRPRLPRSPGRRIRDTFRNALSSSSGENPSIETSSSSNSAMGDLPVARRPRCTLLDIPRRHSASSSLAPH